jgi:hypothetical protein
MRLSIAIRNPLMSLPKVCLTLAALILIAPASHSRADVAYSNLPPNPPFYNSTAGSTVFGDVNNDGNSGSIAMSFVPNADGTISAIVLGVTFTAGSDGNINLSLASNPMTVGAVTTFGSEQALGSVTTTAQTGTTTSALTTLSNPAALPIFAGNTYYLVMTPGDANTSVTWNENVLGATSNYYSSTDLGATFTLGGVFGSDALEVDVSAAAVPEPATWISGAMLAGTIALLGAKRMRRSRAKG